MRWERFYREKAAENGVHLFWLAKEIEHDCNRAYAQTTRFEIAESLMLHLHSKYPVKLVVGMEEGFSGAKYIRYVLEQEWEIPIFDNLADTCQSAVEQVFHL